jgi:Fe2+ transport system protein FeoA
MIFKGQQAWKSVTDSPDTDLPVPSLCRQPGCCSLAQAKTGMILKVRELSAPAEIAGRLRELGFCEQQRVRLLSKHTNVICQVCNVRLGISHDLAQMIVVEPASPDRPKDRHSVNGNQPPHERNPTAP